MGEEKKKIPKWLNDGVMITSTIITNFILQITNLGPNYSVMVLSAINGFLIEYLYGEFKKGTFNIPYIDILFRIIFLVKWYYYMIFGIILFIICNKKYNIIKKIKEYVWKPPVSKEGYITSKIYNPSIVKNISEYIKNCPQFFHNLNSFTIGDPKLISKLATSKEYSNGFEFPYIAYARSPNENIEINIKDTNYNIEGTIVWKIHTEKIKNLTKEGVVSEDDFFLKYIEIKLKSNNISEIDEYIDFISAFNDNQKSNIIIKYHVKVLTDSSGECINDIQEIYSGPPPDLIQREKQYIDTYFHPLKSEIWSLIKKIHYEPDFFIKLGQAPRIGLLLYGPPGTGKSTFAYRVAMALNRHIISIDIRNVKYKSKLYQMIKRPRFNGVKSPSQCVFVFDEFDLTITELYYKEQLNKGLISKWVDNMDKATKFDLNKNKDKDEESDNIQKNKNNNNYLPSLEVNHEEIQLHDLLEIFQGPVPIPGLIVFAMTNKYKEILEMCPALFRPGRLTPYYIGNIDNKTLQEMTKFYFNKELTFIYPDNSTIPTSKLTELVLSSKAKPQSYDLFSNKIQELLKNYEMEYNKKKQSIAYGNEVIKEMQNIVNFY